MALSPSIGRILKRPELLTDLVIKGWIRTIRIQKTKAFLEIGDGSSAISLQAVVDCESAELKARVETLQTGCSASISGQLQKSPKAEQSVELKVSAIELIGECDPATYPLQKKHHTFEFLRTIGHLRPRSATIAAVARLRNGLFMAAHRFFQNREFLFLPSPIITTSDCEGGGDLFRVTTDKKGPEFFGKPAYLTVSGQLNAEIYACAMSRVYTFGPTFRAENSNTSRHLAEFWMIEPEWAFSDLAECAAIAETFVKSLLRAIIENNSDDLKFFDHLSPGLIERLSRWAAEPFAQVSYSEAIEILTRSGKEFRYPCAWGCDLQSEHERFLTESHFDSPIIVTDYPKQLKPFYARVNGDERTVAAMDLLVPQIGEIIGGAQREERLSILTERMEEMKIEKGDYWWYAELRQFGTVPHSGFGAGFERLLRMVTGLDNVRELSPFPRTPGNADF